VASLSQGRTAAAQCGLFTHKSVPVIFEPPCSTKDCVLVEYRLHVPNVHVPGYIINSVMWDSSRVDCSGKYSLNNYDAFYTDYH